MKESSIVKDTALTPIGLNQFYDLFYGKEEQHREKLSILTTRIGHSCYYSTYATRMTWFTS